MPCRMNLSRHGLSIADQLLDVCFALGLKTSAMKLMTTSNIFLDGFLHGSHVCSQLISDVHTRRRLTLPCSSAQLRSSADAIRDQLRGHCMACSSMRVSITHVESNLAAPMAVVQDALVAFGVVLAESVITREFYPPVNTDSSPFRPPADQLRTAQVVPVRR